MAEILVDGTKEFLGGQDASKDPDGIGDTFYFSGVNVRCEKGSLKPRFAYKQRSLTFDDTTISVNNTNVSTAETVFRTGRFQAWIPYVVGLEYGFIAVISGVIFFINQRTFHVTVLPISGGGYLNENAVRINWSPAGRFLVLFDYPNLNVVIEGLTARRVVLANDEIPVSNLGAYNQNRLFISNAGNEFTAGDPSGSLAAPDAPITFMEISSGGPYAGQVFQLSTNYNNDPITAMAFLQVADTSTGIGSLLVATRNGVWAFHSEVPRVDWENSTFGNNFLYNIGIAGPRSFVNVGSDLFFISSDGQIRTASMSRDEQKRWSKTPLSREVQNWLLYVDKSLIPYGTMGFYQNKIFATANPFRTKALTLAGKETFDIAYGGFVVIGTENVSQLGTPGTPAWDGLWTGIHPMDIGVNDDRCFVISKDAEYRNEMYEVTQDSVDEVLGRQRYIRGIVYTKEYDFQDPFLMKQLHSTQLLLEQVKGDFSLKMEYRPANSELYFPWIDWIHKAPYRFCRLPSNGRGLVGHNFMNLNFGITGNGCVLPQEFPASTFERVQLRLQLTGRYWEIHGVKVKAKASKQNQTESACDLYPMAEIPLQCNDDWKTELEDLCQTYST